MSKAYIKRDLAVGKYYADVEGGGSGGGGASYSETESLTGGSWIDGSPIYAKTIEFGALPNNTTKTVAHNITDIDAVVSMTAIATNPNTNTTIPLPYGTDVPNMYFDATNVGIVSTSDVSGYTAAYVTICYTKSE